MRYPGGKNIVVSRNFGIDVMRGIAILLVVIHHLALPFRLPLALSGLGEVLSRRIANGLSFNGYEAVFVFFVLSGFLTTRRATQQFRALEKIQWRVFYRQRASRIVRLGKACECCISRPAARWVLGRVGTV